VPQAIPKEHERGLVLIKSLEDSDIGRIVESMKDASPGLDSHQILSIIRPIIPGVADEDAEKISETLYSLYSFIGHSDISIESFLDDISESTATTDNQDLRTSTVEERSSLRSKLRSLLTVRPLAILSKARALKRDSANIFSDARIISDIRPVWDGEVTEPPEGIVISQTLKLIYYDLVGLKEIYLSIGSDDIDNLINILQRAQAKAESLTALAGRTSMKILE
jgi:hypothetical protein